MRVLVLTTLYPTPQAPHRAGFMPGRLAALARFAEVRAVVPYPTFPLARWLGRGERPPPREEGERYEVRRCPYFAPPGVARRWRPEAIVRGAATTVQRVAAEFEPDIVLGHFLFPDGVAAVTIAERLGLPVVLVAHGSDVNQLALIPAYRERIAAALAAAAGLIVVSHALQAKLASLGLRSADAVVIPCGYDARRFQPRSRAEARRELRLPDGRWLLYLGALRRLKRVDVVIDALAKLPAVRLAIVGDGPEAARLADQARRLGVAARVLWVGPVAHERVPLWLSAADAVVLASEHEGLPTVLTEALATGTPVVATRVGGIPELLGDVCPMVRPGDPDALAAAIQGVLDTPPPPAALIARAAPYEWGLLGAAEAEALRAALVRRAAGES